MLNHWGCRNEGDSPFLPGAHDLTGFPSVNILPLPSASAVPPTLLCPTSPGTMAFSAPPLILVIASIRARNRQHTKTPKPQQTQLSHKDLCGDRDWRSSETSSSEPAEKVCSDLILHRTRAIQTPRFLKTSVKAVPSSPLRRNCRKWEK